MDTQFKSIQDRYNINITFSNFTLAGSRFNDLENNKIDMFDALLGGINHVDIEKLEKFKEQQSSISKILKKNFINKIKSEHCYYNLLQFVFGQFEEIINKYFLNTGDSHNANIFTEVVMNVISFLRYSEIKIENKKQVIDDSLKLFTEVQEELKKVLAFDKEDLNTCENLIQLMDKILLDPDSLDMPLLCYLYKYNDLTFKQSSITYDVSVINLKAGYHELLNKIRSNFIIIAKLIEEKITPHKKNRQHDVLNPSSKLLNLLKKYKDEIIPSLNKFNIDDINQIFKLIPYLLETLNKVNYLFNNHSDPLINFGPTLKRLRVIQQIKEDTSLNPYRINMDKYFGFDKNISNPVCENPGYWSLHELLQANDCQQDMYYIHCLGDAFISNLTVSLRDRIIPGLQNWNEKHVLDKNYQILLKNVFPSVQEKIEKKDEKKSSKDVKQTQKVDYNKIAEFIEGSKNKKPKKTTKPKLEDNKPFSMTFSKQDNELISSLLLELSSINKEKADKASMSLQECLMYLLDTMQLQKELENIGSINPKDKQSLILQQIYNIYNTIQLALRYKNFITSGLDNNNFDHHNLKGLFHQWSDEKKGTIPSIINEFFLANFWITFTFEQNNRWKTWIDKDPPMLLKNICVLESDQFDEISKIQDCIKTHFTDCVKYMQTLFPLKEQKESPLQINVKTLQFMQPSTSIKISHLNNLLKDIQEFEKTLTLHSSSPAYEKLNQITVDLQSLIQSINSFNKPYSSTQFSPLIRKIFTKQSRIIEQILQIIYEIQSVNPILQHNIAELTKNISFKNVSKESIQFLDSNYDNSYKITRNPFQEIQHSKTPILSLILKGEKVRSSELSFNLKDEQIKDLDIKSLHGEVAQIHQKTVNIIEKELLPEMKEALLLSRK